MTRTPFHKRWAPKNASTQASPPPEEQARFQGLLRELFQFDCADLDFGIYRIMNHKREVIDRYIDRDLPGAIEEAVSEGALETEGKRADTFEETRQQVVDSFGENVIAPNGELVKYEETPLGKKYILWRERARHAESAGDVRRDIYNHLYAFFSRYYQDGDFVPKRRYSWEHPLSANTRETREEQEIRVGRDREIEDGTRRRNEGERNAPLFRGGRAKRGGFRGGSGGVGEGDAAALHGGVQAVDRRGGGRLRDVGRDRSVASARGIVRLAPVGVAESGAGGIAAGAGEETRTEALGREA